MDIARPQRKSLTQEHLEKGSEEGNVDGWFQDIPVQLEEDGGSSSRQSWMEWSGLWPTVHQERQVKCMQPLSVVS